MKNRPHLVILGAGASVAAIPNGDLNGNKTSVMAGFIEKLGMSEVIRDANLKTTSNNLEDIYSELAEDSIFDSIRLELEEKIHTYFSKFQIPNEPTVYDLLILSLRPKDCIATFNWDPLLLQAYQRASQITKELPELAFLHGNVMVGTCDNDKINGIYGTICNKCGNPFRKEQLLFPVKDKDYSSSPSIKFHWDKTRNFLKLAYMVTIFGYSAPTTDREAIKLFKSAWGSNIDREFEEFEIIDIADENSLKNTWNSFIHTHHYEIHQSFFNSQIAQFPRRSTEALFDRTMKNKWLTPNDKLTPEMDIQEISKIVKRLVNEELTTIAPFITMNE